MYEDGVFPTTDGKARFADVAYVPVAEPRESRFPFSLITGRLRDQWHGMSRTGTLGRLFGHVSEPAMDLHPQDMQRLGLQDGDVVRVASRRGQMYIPAKASASVRPRQAFIAMHWGQEFLSGQDDRGQVTSGVNAVTNSASCPTSRQPELKHAAVHITPAHLPWRVLAVAWLSEAEALTVREAIKPLMRQFTFSSCVPFGREPHAEGKVGLLFRAAHAEPVSDDLITQLTEHMGVTGVDLLRYQDKARSQRRLMRME